MRTMQRPLFTLITLLVSCVGLAANAQPAAAQPAAPLDWSADDGKRVEAAKARR